MRAAENQKARYNQFEAPLLLAITYGTALQLKIESLTACKNGNAAFFAGLTIESSEFYYSRKKIRTTEVSPALWVIGQNSS